MKLNVNQINILKDKKIITRVIPSDLLTDLTIDDLKIKELITLTDPSEDIEEVLEPGPGPSPIDEYFTIEATEDDTVLSWLFPSGPDVSKAVTIEWSSNNGLTWTSVTADVNAEGNIGTFNAGDKIIFRGNGATGFYYEENVDYCDGNFLRANKPCYVYGNVMSLIYGKNFAVETTVPEYALSYLFSSYKNDWVLFKTSSPLVLPATTLANNCYSGLFAGCTSLVSAPELPATTLANYCYSNMFAGCTSLVSAPELPVTTLADSCYGGMFYECTSLVSAPELPATTLANYCYVSMFNGCTSLTSVKCLASAVSPSNAVTNWLNYVSPTGTFTKAAGVSWPTGEDGIPSGWEVEEI